MKKILIIIFLVMAIFQMVVLATDIEIGCPAIDGDSNLGTNNKTVVDRNNPANGTGKITSIEIWAKVEMTGVKIAIFRLVSGNNLSTYDYETIQIDGQDPGVVPAGSKQTATVDLDVEEGDYIGLYYATGDIELDYFVSDGIWWSVGDKIPCTDVTFNTVGNNNMSLCGTGTTEEEEGNAIWFGMCF